MTARLPKKTPPADLGKSPAVLIDARIAELPDWCGQMLAQLRAVIRSADPGVVEEWKWNVPALLAVNVTIPETRSGATTAPSVAWSALAQVERRQMKAEGFNRSDQPPQRTSAGQSTLAFRSQCRRDGDEVTPEAVGGRIGLTRQPRRPWWCLADNLDISCRQPRINA